ncbi:uncharacterized mitochondrial protein-like protein, partial [Tanacetum coccineum]
KEDNINSTNNVNIARTNEVNVVGGKTSIKLPFDPNMSALEDYGDDEDDGAEPDMNNLDTTIQVSPIPTTKVHKDHPLDQVIGDLQSATQTRRMSKKLEEHGFVSTIQQRTNHKDLQNCLFACFLSYEEPKRIEAIRLFLAYASFKDFVVYQMDVKSVFLYGKIEEEVYVCQPPGFEDPDFPDRVYKQKKDDIFISQDKYVDEILKKFRFTEVKTSSTPMETQKPLLKDENDEEVDVHICQVNLKASHLHAVKMIISDYARESLDRKSTTGGCQFLRCRLISYQCKKQIVVVNSTTEAEYVAASSCCGQVLWIQNQLLDYRNGYLRKGRKTKPKRQNRTRNGKAWKRQSQDQAQVSKSQPKSTPTNPEVNK